jgi:hypothetical protein
MMSFYYYLRLSCIEQPTRKVHSFLQQKLGNYSKGQTIPLICIYETNLHPSNYLYSLLLKLNLQRMSY